MSAGPSFLLDGVVAGPVDEPILRGVSTEIPSGGITALVGPSGAGKSTLLRLLNRLDEPLSGSILFDGAPIVDIDPIELRRRVAMVFQRPPLFQGDVLANLRVAEPDLTEAEAIAALRRVGLDGALLRREAVDLSGGEAQRLCLARALLTDPVVVLADEPTASLDGPARRMLEVLARQIAATGVGIVWVTHDVEQLRRLADRAIVLIDGVVAADGAPDELVNSDQAEVRELWA